jgi:hypothetical protein
VREACTIPQGLCTPLPPGLLSDSLSDDGVEHWLEYVVSPPYHKIVRRVSNPELSLTLIGEPASNPYWCEREPERNGCADSQPHYCTSSQQYCFYHSYYPSRIFVSTLSEWLRLIDIRRAFHTGTSCLSQYSSANCWKSSVSRLCSAILYY